MRLELAPLRSGDGRAKPDHDARSPYLSIVPVRLIFFCSSSTP